ncbi:glycoside hydrolase family 18 protein [soil metagenome]
MIRKTQQMSHKSRLSLSKKKVIGIFFLVTGLIFLLYGLWWMFFRSTQLLSPISQNSSFQFLFNGEQTDAHAKRVVYGFLPYWNLNKFTLQPETTHLSYFSLGIGKDGSILTKTKDGTAEQGYAKLSSEDVLSFFNQERNQGGRVDITFTAFDPEEIASFLANPNAHQKFITSLDSILEAYPVDGVNIDIEYTGEVNDQIRQNLVTFMTELHTHLNQKKTPVQLSIDMFVSGASKYYIWNVPEIQKQVDYVVVMAYDFHRVSSPAAGPVAPLFGGKKLWDSDITQYLKDFVAAVPNQKILLGIPFYGYEWQTISTDSQAATFPDSGSTATLQRVQDLIDSKDKNQGKEYGNEDALSPYLSYKKDGETHIIYYENSRSISYKLDLVNQLNLGGIAIWSLGYEGNSRDLWDVIKRKI